MRYHLYHQPFLLGCELKMAEAFLQCPVAY